MEKKGNQVTLRYVNKPLEFFSHEFEDLEEQKIQNEESIKKTLKVMKNRNFSETQAAKAKPKKEGGAKGLDNVEEADDENLEDEGRKGVIGSAEGAGQRRLRRFPDFGRD